MFGHIFSTSPKQCVVRAVRGGFMNYYRAGLIPDKIKFTKSPFGITLAKLPVIVKPPRRRYLDSFADKYCH